jgi:beta-lactamase class A
MKLFLLILLAALGILPGVVQAGAAAGTTLPLKVAERDWRPLDQRRHQALQGKLDRALGQHPLWQTLIGEGRMAVALVDLANPRVPRAAQVNGNTMMYAASLPKIAVLLAAFQGFENRTLKETPEIRAEMVEMIRRSDNAAATKVIGRLSLPGIARVILDPRYRFYDQKHGGGLWVGSDYGPHLEQNPEPLKGLLHAATVNQVARFYYLLAYGRLINPQRSRQMLTILAFPDLDDKFIKALGNSVPQNQVFRKSGDWKQWYSDSMLVWAGGWRRYILVAMVDDAQGEKILQALVPAVEQILRPGSPSRARPRR